jgi:caa(3)-type oxidase subunit IV
METRPSKVEKHHHHILSNTMALGIGGALLFLTVVTVWVAHIDLGPLNFVVAMLVATIKASLVALFFMNLFYDHKENGVIFGTSFLFLIIFIVLTGTDLFFRGDVAVKGPLMAATSVKSKLEKPWVSTPELVSKGKELFQAQCTSCHGVEGKGNGPAAAALNPPPRNFTADQGWKNGRKVSMVFKTLKEGLAGSSMASYATLPVDDRWALVHYVISLGGKPAEADSEADFAKAGISTSGGGEAPEAPTIPVSVAMKQMEVKAMTPTGVVLPFFQEGQGAAQSAGGKVYAARCLNCHGAQAKGGIIVKSMGVNPRADLISSPLSANLASIQSFEGFKKVVVDGLPGEKVMPGAGDLSATELQELYQYVKSLIH